MSKLYDLVNDILTTSNLDEAEDILYGININSEEYFQNIISNFIRKKEYVIRKENGNLVFDLNSYNDMYNIIFLGEYIKGNDFLYNNYRILQEEIEYMDRQLSMIKNKHALVKNKDITNEAKIKEHNDINTRYQQVKRELDAKKAELENMKSVKETFYNIDWVKLENTNNEIERLEAVKILKQAINIIHKLRSSIQHGTADVGKYLTIDDGQFKISMPIDYLDGFNKGRIIANYEDQVIVERTNRTASALLESLGYNVKKVQSFFYNVDPEHLNFLLEQVNYDYDELYKLSENIFTYGSSVREFLKKGYTLNDLNNLPNIAFWDVALTMKLKEKDIDIYRLSEGSFMHLDSIMELKENGIDIYSLPISAYVKSDYVKNLIKLKKNNININNLSAPFFYPEVAIELKNSGIDIYNLPDLAYFYPEAAIKLKNSGIDIYNLPNIAFYKPEEAIKLDNNNLDVSKLPDIAFYIPEAAIKLHNNEINIYNISDSAYYEPDTTIRLKQSGIDIYNLPGSACFYPEEAMKLKNSGIDIYNLPDSAFYKPEEAIKLRNSGIDIYNLPDSAFNYPDTVIRLKNSGINISNLSDREILYPEAAIKLNKNNIAINKVSEAAFKHPDSAIRLNNNGIDIYNLPDVAFSKPNTAIKLKNSGIDINNLPDRILYSYPIKLNNGVIYIKVPDAVFLYPDSVIELKNRGIDINNLSFNKPIEIKQIQETITKLHKNGIDVNNTFVSDFSVYSVSIESFCSFAIECKKNDIDIHKLPFNAYTNADHIDNIKYMLFLVNNDYEKLKEFPEEFFTCDLSLIDEMYKTYNANVIKSIFGIKKPKVIATLIYCNSVLRNYQKENIDADIIDIDPGKFASLGYYNTLDYKNNINDVEMNSISYYQQFTIDYDGKSRDINSKKNNILDKLRNSICHFRFKLVKDSNGNIIEDKIYLYDKFDNSNRTNFNIILDLQDLVDITRKIELSLESRGDYIINGQNEHNAARTR